MSEISNSHRPQLWVIAGPNGAGKSTLVRRYLRRPLPVINPDEIAAQIAPDRVNDVTVKLEAGRRAVTERSSLLGVGASFLVETTLTGHSELRLLRDARAANYKVTLVYVGLSPWLFNARDEPGEPGRRSRRGRRDSGPD